MDLKGIAVFWPPLLDPVTGALTLMTKCKLDILGLPGARLPSSFRLPAKYGVQAWATGGPSYASVAVLWKTRPGHHVEILRDLSEGRIVWLRVSACSLTFFICFFYLPPANSKEHEVEFVSTVSMIDATIAVLRSRLQEGKDLYVVLSGDANLQPSMLSDSGRAHPSREGMWSTLLVKHGLRLSNPSSLGATAHRVPLLCYGKEVKVKRGDTLHSCTPGRTIDLTAVSCSLQEHYLLHNGVHCKEGFACTAMHCKDFCRSDHFLQETRVMDVKAEAQGDGVLPSFPRRWSESPAWRQGLDVFTPCLSRLTNIVDSCLTLKAGLFTHGCALGNWLLDASATLQNFVGNAVRECYVQANSILRSCPKRVSSSNHQGGVSESRNDDVLRRLQRSLQDSGQPMELTNECFRCLRPVQPRPTLQMTQGGVSLSPADTHAAWCALGSNTALAANMPAHLLGKLQQDLRSSVGRALQQQGKLVSDEQVTAGLVRTIVDRWDKSSAVPPDLLPRIVFTMRHGAWDSLVLALIRLAGPAVLARRATLWRLALLWPIFKKGAGDAIESYRRIWIRSQMGLLQEGTFSLMCKPDIVAALTRGQSGYVRDVADAHLLLDAILSFRKQHNLPLFMLPGDFVKAFPRVLREDLLLLLNRQAKLRGGCFLLMVDIFSLDLLVVPVSGCSRVDVVTGLPEGGVAGPLTYTTLPDSLARKLHDKGFGVALRPVVPRQWEKRCWNGAGTPRRDLVDAIRHALQNGGAIPPPEALDSDLQLEASALKAMDLAGDRLSGIWHADDPLFLASSAGDLQALVLELAEWAQEHNAKFHVGNTKTVAMCWRTSEGPLPALTFPALGRASAQAICYKTMQKWLGWMLQPDEGASATLNARLHAAGDEFAGIAGLVAAGSLPLPQALSVTRAKVDGIMAPGRWLYALAPDAQVMLDTAQARWALVLLGADPWRSRHIAWLELGWNLSAFAKAVEAVARRRARLTLLPQDDFYRGVFVDGHMDPLSWPSKSRKLLAEWDLADFYGSRGAQQDLAAYFRYVKTTLVQICAQKWAPALAKHVQPFPYVQIQHNMGNITMSLASRTLCHWDELLGTRSWCRLRAGLVRLSHRFHKRSNAKVQLCIFCDVCVSDAYAHAFGECAEWADLRLPPIVDIMRQAPTSGLHVAASILGIVPPHRLWRHILRWSLQIDRAASAFWQQRID
jgi:hypothetical protein